MVRALLVLVNAILQITLTHSQKCVSQLVLNLTIFLVRIQQENVLKIVQLLLTHMLMKMCDYVFLLAHSFFNML